MIKVCVISAAYSILALPISLQAQIDTVTVNKSVEIEEIIISSPQAASTYSALTRAVLVITSDEFTDLPVNSLNDLLGNIASIDIRQRGEHGVQADLMIRGGTFDQVLILLNGVNISDPQTGHHNLNIPIDIESIDRIEILQGPGSRVYGPGAFSGAINIITHTNPKSLVKVGIRAGNFGLIKSDASLGLNSLKNKFFIATSSAKSDGYTKNTDFYTHNLFGYGKINLGKGYLSLQTGYQSKAFGAQGFYSPKFPEQFEQTSTFISSASYNYKWGKVDITPSIYFRKHNDRFELFRYNSPEWYNGHNYHSTSVMGARVEAINLNKVGRTRIGADVKYEGIYSNVLGELLLNPIPISNTDKSYTHGAFRKMAGMFAEHTLYLNRFTISFGGQFTLSNAFSHHQNYGVDAAYSINRAISISASANNTIRYPNFTDLYYNGPTNIGNPKLKPERADNYELAMKYRANLCSANLILYNRIGNQVIDWVKNTEDEKWTTINHTRLNTKGFETNVKFDFTNTNTILLNTTASYSFMHTDKESGKLQSFYALDYLKHKLTTNITFKIFKSFRGSLTAAWQSRAGTYTQYTSNEEKVYEPFTIMDASISYKAQNFTAFIDINNLFNKHYTDLGNIPQPGAWVSIGVKCQIEPKESIWNQFNFK